MKILNLVYLDEEKQIIFSYTGFKIHVEHKRITIDDICENLKTTVIEFDSISSRYFVELLGNHSDLAMKIRTNDWIKLKLKQVAKEFPRPVYKIITE